MTSKQREILMEIIQDHGRRASARPDDARRLLIEEGIYTEDGQLAPEYGGEVGNAIIGDPISN